ncbi:hypothetical protein [Alloactinosynnema sp. L-07]|nr:hypothetical protein [Alloactinosynnema sp. L-07]
MPTRRADSGARPGMGPNPDACLVVVDPVDHDIGQMRKKEVKTLMITPGT